MGLVSLCALAAIVSYHGFLSKPLSNRKYPSYPNRNTDSAGASGNEYIRSLHGSYRYKTDIQPELGVIVAHCNGGPQSSLHSICSLCPNIDLPSSHNWRPSEQKVYCCMNVSELHDLLLDRQLRVVNQVNIPSLYTLRRFALSSISMQSPIQDPLFVVVVIILDASPRLRPLLPRVGHRLLSRWSLPNWSHQTTSC